MSFCSFVPNKTQIPGKALNFQLNCLLYGFILSIIPIVDGMLWFKHYGCKKIYNVLQIRGTIVVVGYGQTKLLVLLISQLQMYDTTIHVISISKLERKYPINIEIILKQINLVDRWIKRCNIPSSIYFSHNVYIIF